MNKEFVVVESFLRDTKTGRVMSAVGSTRAKYQKNMVRTAQTMQGRKNGKLVFIRSRTISEHNSLEEADNAREKYIREVKPELNGHFTKGYYIDCSDK